MDGFGKVYNILPIAGSQRNRRYTPLTIERMSKSAKRRDNSELWRHGAKLNEGKVFTILSEFNKGVGRGELSKRYNVTRTQINSIIRGATWKKVYEKYHEIDE